MRLLDAVPLWWLFRRRGWPDGLPGDVRAHLCCQRCRSAGRLVRPALRVTRERPEGPQPSYPDEREWRRVVSRYRS